MLIGQVPSKRRAPAGVGGDRWGRGGGQGGAQGRSVVNGIRLLGAGHVQHRGVHRAHDIARSLPPPTVRLPRGQDEHRSTESEYINWGDCGRSVDPEGRILDFSGEVPRLYCTDPRR